MAGRKTTGKKPDNSAALQPAAAGSVNHIGRHEAAIPQDWLDTFIAGLSDRDALSLTREVALIDSRLAEIHRELQRDESLYGWQDVINAVSELHRGFVRRERLAVDAAAQRLDDIASGKRAYLYRMKEWRELIELRRKLVATEVKSKEFLSQFVTIENVQLMLRLIFAVIESELRDIDPQRLRAVVLGIQQVLKGEVRAAASGIPRD